MRDIFTVGSLYLQSVRTLSKEEVESETGMLIDIIVKVLSRVKDEEETVRVNI